MIVTCRVCCHLLNAVLIKWELLHLLSEFKLAYLFHKQVSDFGSTQPIIFQQLHLGGFTLVPFFSVKLKTIIPRIMLYSAGILTKFFTSKWVDKCKLPNLMLSYVWVDKFTESYVFRKIRSALCITPWGYNRDLDIAPWGSEFILENCIAWKFKNQTIRIMQSKIGVNSQSL